MVNQDDTQQESPTGGQVKRSRSLFGKLLLAFLFLSVAPLFITGILVTAEVDRLREHTVRTSRTYERRAENIARSVADFLRKCESDLRRLAKLPRSDESYAAFALKHKREAWIRSGTDENPTEERVKVLLYKEVSFIDLEGKEQVLVVRGKPVSADQRRIVSDLKHTTYRSERYFQEAMQIGKDEIYVGHLSGFHVNKIEQLGIEKLIPRLKQRGNREKQIYRYILYKILRASGEVEYVNSFQERQQNVRVYRVPGKGTRILVDEPKDLTPEEVQARELELMDILNQLAPEDTREGETYDGVIRFAMPVFSEQGNRLGVVSIALDHLHLLQFTQHVKAMEIDATVFAGYRDADYTYLFDDEGWIITHPKFWNIRGADGDGRLLAPYTEKTTESEKLVGRTPVNLLHVDWNMGEGYHAVVLETRAGRTGIATSVNLSGVLRTRVYSPIFYDTGPYSKYGIFGGVMLGTRVDKFVDLMRKIGAQVVTRTSRVYQTLMVALVVSLALVLLLSVLMARGLVQPVRTLTEAARHIGLGHLDVEIPSCGQDEIGELADSFRDMTGRLKTNIEKLERRNVQLKQAQEKLLEAEQRKRLELQKEVQELQKEVTRASFSNMIVYSAPMKKIQEEIVRISNSSATVLILGENGTGKELVAEAIHKNSPRRDKLFLKINCAAYNENLLESELFGHMKGSYTGAVQNRKGLFESAHGGTLLLDEIGDMSLSMQKKLLRTLQEGEVVPVGSTQIKKIDVRIVAATNKDLFNLMREGMFREDLFHRINVISLKIPPLRERKEDILPLARHFLSVIIKKEGRAPVAIEHQAERYLEEYRWSGNVRELENAMERAVIRSRGHTLRVEDFQLAMEDDTEISLVEQADTGKTLEEVEKAYILSVLEKNLGNKKSTAKQLGIGYNTLWRKLKQYNKL